MIALATVLALVATQTPAVEQRVKEIRALYETTNARVKRLTPEYHCSDGERWKRVDRAGLEDERCNLSAQYFVADGKPLKAILGFWTPSGDWSSQVELYFDSAGRTVFRYELLSTFYGGDEALVGPFRVETRTYYGRTGKVVRELVSAVQAGSGKKVSPEIVYRQNTPRPQSARDLEFLQRPDAGTR